MTYRTELPLAATTITPGYSWHLILDVIFGGERPLDWEAWDIRMHLWNKDLRLQLRLGSGISFEAVEELEGETFPRIVPVLSLSAEQTAMLSGTAKAISYVIDFLPPGGEREDYFAGYFTRIPAPPQEMLA